MNNGPLLFLGLFATLAGSFWTLLLAPQLQIGRQQPLVLASTGEYYPAARPGLAQQGAEVYRSLGCAECHTRQVRQTGVEFDVWLTEPGTNKPALITALTQLKVADAARLVEQLPARVLRGLDMAASQSFAAQLSKNEAKAQHVLVTLGPDIERGWGRRVTVSQDYLRDYPVQVGGLRVGPDLANYGARTPPLLAVLQHLYNPQKTMPGSMMPPHRFLFAKRKLAAGEPPRAGALPADFEPGYEVLPTPDAEALAAYLASLSADAPLINAPVSAPPQAASANAASIPAK